MGFTHYSEAVIFTTEPEKIRGLIGQIYNLEPNKHGYCRLKPDANYAASTLCDLKIEENSITFNSGGYGIFGLDKDWLTNDGELLLLFKYLFENFDGSLVCHESIEDCNERDNYYAATWKKDYGKYDVNEDEYEYIYTHIISKTLDYYDLDFSGYLVWCTYLGDRLITSASKQLIEAAKAKGFQDWATEEELEEHYNSNESITFDTIWKIGEEFPELEDLVFDVITEAEKIMFELNKLVVHPEGFPEELEEQIKKYNKRIGL